MRSSRSAALATLALTLVAAGSVTSPAASAAPEPSPSSPSSDQPRGAKEWTISPGRIGPIRAGMTYAELLQTSIFYLTEFEQQCPRAITARPWFEVNTWWNLDESTQTLTSATSSRRNYWPTSRGVEVGDTLRDFRQAYPRASPIRVSDEGRQWLSVRHGDRYLSVNLGYPTVTPRSELFNFGVSVGAPLEPFVLPCRG